MAAAMMGGLGGAGEVDTDDEEEGGSERDLEEPLCALVKNCNMLHNIVGPACIFLRQGFAQSQLVCMTLTHTRFTTHTYTWYAVGIIVAKISSTNLFIHPFS